MPCPDADLFKGLLSGMARMKELVVELLGPLVPRKAQAQLAASGVEILDDELSGGDKDDTDENNIDCRTSSGGPSAK